MMFDEMMKKVNEEGVSEDIKRKRLQELREFIQFQSHVHDDHGSAIIGSRNKEPYLDE